MNLKRNKKLKILANIRISVSMFGELRLENEQYESSACSKQKEMVSNEMEPARMSSESDTS